MPFPSMRDQCAAAHRGGMRVRLVRVATICFAALLVQPAVAKVASKGKDPAAQAVTSSSENAASSEAGGTAAPPSEDKAAEAAPAVWSEEEIAQAKAHCEKVLHGVEAVIEPAEPIKDGECGAPAPVRLISIGRNPEVALSPPVTVNCDLVATLASWVKEDLQPLARKHLGAPIVGMRTMSSYSCRNAYGRKSTRLSEHALANAIDVGSFRTSDGKEADLLKGWGLTARDVQAIVAKAKAAEKERKIANADKAKTSGTAVADAAKPKAKGQVFLTASSSSVAPLPVRKPPDAAREWRVRLVTTARAATTQPPLPKRAKPQSASGTVLASTASHLGGPDAEAADVTPQAFDPDDGVALFLRAAHETACKRFGTVLGPEANEAHRNHFHLDMAKRRYGNYCE